MCSIVKVFCGVEKGIPQVPRAGRTDNSGIPLLIKIMRSGSNPSSVVVCGRFFLKLHRLDHFDQCLLRHDARLREP